MSDEPVDTTATPEQPSPPARWNTYMTLDADLPHRIEIPTLLTTGINLPVSLAPKWDAGSMIDAVSDLTQPPFSLRLRDDVAGWLDREAAGAWALRARGVQIGGPPPELSVRFASDDDAAMFRLAWC